MSDSSALPKSCPKCGADLPSEATEGLCPRCILSQAMQSTGPKTPAGRWEPPTAEELQKLLPQYEITALLGRGGMGAVYKGTQIALDRPVAIKILSNQLEAADASFAERFKNEAKAMAKLSHPGIVSVYDFGETAGGLLFIVMEFIEGTDVAKMISKQGRLHTEHAMAITAHVCDALAYAHERGIIHRDIKPANIMVGYDGVVKVADFGLAKMSHDNRSGLTQSGMAMGTLHYMAPEALMLGSSVDQRADIYAVGVMLYQMLTGKLPQGLFEMPSLQVKGLDPRYDGIISKALREDREVRYSNALAMRFDLDAILTKPVIKVEAAAEKAPAALPTQARPQRPAGQPYRPPPPQVILQPLKKGSPLLWGALLAMTVAAAWFYFKGSFVINVDPSDGGSQVNVTTLTENSEPTAPVLAEISKDVPFVNLLGMKFVPLPGTTTLMCIHETRRQDYEAYNAEVNGVNNLWFAIKKSDTPVGHEPSHPVVNTSWNDAKDFCAWLSKKEGRLYRLPTDREWSIAVGIANLETDTTASPEMLGQRNRELYHWGTEWPPPPGIGNFSDDSHFNTFHEGTIEGYRDSFVTTAPVMSFPPNQLGIYDLAGNVWEYCEEWVNDAHEFKVIRGGHFSDCKPKYLVKSYRGTRTIDSRMLCDGFRCVLVPDEIGYSDQTRPSSNMLTTAPAVVPPPVQTTNIASVPTVVDTTTWTDTQGRSITAKFKAIASGNVLLEIAGKVHPVALNALSVESQQQAQALAQQTTSLSSVTVLTKATKDKPFTNSLGMKFVPVPGTKVLFGTFEVRHQDYAAYAAESSGVDGSWKIQSSDGYTPTDKKEQHPVMKVNWEDAQKFCAWLSQKEGITFRLPTDQEWSIAVGIDGETWQQDTTPATVFKNQADFPWEAPWPPPEGSGNYSDDSRKAKAPRVGGLYLDAYDDGFPASAPVMSFKPNKLGLYDMGGNAWEWCEDWYEAAHESRALRGGSWYSGSRSNLLSSSRIGIKPGRRLNDIGFRCVIELPLPASTTLTPPSASPIRAATARKNTNPYDTESYPTALSAFDAFLRKRQPAGSPNYLDVASLRSLYEACVQRAIALCTTNPTRNGELAAFQEELQRVRRSIFPDGSSTAKMPASLATLRNAYWQAALESDSRADAKQR